MVAFYPDRDTSYTVALALIKGGASYLEVQFPFSDPTADGVFIQKACDTAIEKGFTIEDGFQLIAKIRKHSDIPIFIMGYANTVFFHGIEPFLEKCRYNDVQGLIIPDLPADYDEGLYRIAKHLHLNAVPVIAPSTEDKRLQMILDNKPEYVYAALRKGITGAYTEIGETNIKFLRKIDTKGSKILAGFGIAQKEQVKALAPYVHAAVVGSAFIRAIMELKDESIHRVILQKMKSLL
jgi:tryptophan synthase alpha chain